MFRSICGALTCVVAFANWNDTATGINFDALPHLRLTKLRSGFLKDGERATFDRITATAASGNQRGVVLRGIGKSGRHWEIHSFNLDEVYRGDLDANGTPDYVFFGGGPYFNGRMTPLFSLSILMMDRDGMPVPFFTVVYTGENGDGIKHILDLNRDGHAQVLISMYDEIPSDPKAQFCSGHWTNQVYQFTNLAAQEVRGTIGGIQFPLVHNWSYGAALCGESPPELNLVRAPEIVDHETGSQGSLRTKIQSVDRGIDILQIDPVSGCQFVKAPLLVYDRPHLREIAFPSMWSSDWSDLADRIRADGATIELRGFHRTTRDDCGANLIWASRN